MKHKQSGRVTALLLSAVLTLCLLPLPVRAAGAEARVQLGDYIQLGRYDGEPILWRCVSVDMGECINVYSYYCVYRYRRSEYHYFRLGNLLV